MNYNRIKFLQKEHGYDEIQKYINTGLAWRLEGSYGREAMSLLEAGVCMLPKTPQYDFYGNYIPSRDELKNGTKGTYQNSVEFWTKVDNGECLIF